MKLRIAGRIDRIDQVGPATFEIVDYKTGGYWRRRLEGHVRRRHAAAARALRPRGASSCSDARTRRRVVSGAEYYFPSAKGKQERKRIPTPSVAAVGAVLADLRDVIASGLFVHAPDKESCKWCDFGHACGQNAAERAEAKLADPKLAPFVKLVAHE